MPARMRKERGTRSHGLRPFRHHRPDSLRRSFAAPIGRRGRRGIGQGARLFESGQLDLSSPPRRRRVPRGHLRHRHRSRWRPCRPATEGRPRCARRLLLRLPDRLQGQVGQCRHELGPGRGALGHLRPGRSAGRAVPAVRPRAIDSSPSPAWARISGAPKAACGQFAPTPPGSPAERRICLPCSRPRAARPS
jgi:hypothetical protein